LKIDDYRFEKKYLIFVFVAMKELISKYVLLMIFITFGFASFAQNDVNPDGENVFYFDNGNKSSEGKMVNGKPEGYWKAYHENGNIKSEGNRKNGLIDGLWKFYSDKGILTSEISFVENKKNGVSKTYNLEGFLVLQEQYKNGAKNGYEYRFYNNGKIKSSVKYLEGRKNGLYYEFDKNETVNTIKEYKKGKLLKTEVINRKNKFGKKQGLYRGFYYCKNPCDKDLIRKWEGRFENGLKNGYFREYDEKGDLISTVKYLKGEIVTDENNVTLETKKEYFDNGKVKSEANFVDGKQHGMFRNYDEDGNVLSGGVFNNGVKLGEGIPDKAGVKQGFWKEYYTTGELRSEGKYIDGERVDVWKFYHKNGKIEQTGKYKKGQLPIGTWKWYYESGNLLRTEEFSNGIEYGEYVEYSDSGSVITKGEFVDGLKEGFWIYDYGDYREEGEYVGGAKSGEWKHYYQNGELSFKGSFVDDMADGKHTYYYPNKKRKWEGKYVSDRKDGLWRRFNQKGEVILEILYDFGTEKKFDNVKVKPFLDR
jgi:antitoxin component YwqK of YwqJK toxin-antitoxin module